MVYEIQYKDSVRKDLRKLDKAISKRILDKIRETLENNPRAGTPLKGKLTGMWRIRVGDFRVAYIIHGNFVLVINIGPRKNVYR